MTRFALSLSAAAAALAGSAVYAAAPAAPVPPVAVVRPMPPMGDRTISRAEAQTLATTRFDRMDANHDGKIDSADRTAEMTAMFDRIDTDHNGSISRDEFAAMHSGGRMGMERGGMERGGMERGGMNHEGMNHEGMAREGRGARAGGGMAGMGGRMADANGDRTVTRDEFVTAAMRRFDMIDTDKNGTVTPAEQRAAMAAAQARMAQMRGADNAPPPPPPGE